MNKFILCLHIWCCWSISFAMGLFFETVTPTIGIIGLSLIIFNVVAIYRITEKGDL